MLFYNVFTKSIYNRIQWIVIAVLITILSSCGSINNRKYNIALITSNMRLIYEKYPSLRTNSNPNVIKQIAASILSHNQTHDLINFMLYNNNLFQKIRLLLVKELAQNKVIGHAVVSGQSITGMIAAAILAYSGYRVDVYDIRERYTRNIQWVGRQSLIDELASIDLELSNRFLRHVGTPLYRGSIHLKPNGIRKYSKHNGPKLGNPIKIPLNSTEMVNNPSVVNMEAKVFEKMLKEYLKTLPRVQHHIGSINLKRCHNKNYYCIVQNNKQDIIPNIIIIAEGSNSKTRSMLGIKSMPSSPARLQIAGSIYIDGGGVMVKHWRNEHGETLLTGLMGKKGAGKTWMVADVQITQITPNSKYGLDIHSRTYNEEKQRLIHREFRRLISESMELPIKIVQNIKIEGAIEGVSISPFTLQQRISTRAYAGNNVILLGDAVGNSHWSVGGGMQIGAVSHAERLKTLLLDIDLGIPREKALQGYSNAVLNDTKVWAEIGLADFYPSLDKEFIKHAYNDSIAMEKR